LYSPGTSIPFRSLVLTAHLHPVPEPCTHRAPPSRSGALYSPCTSIPFWH
jgi:hypothetical protein